MANERPPLSGLGLPFLDANILSGALRTTLSTGLDIIRWGQRPDTAASRRQAFPIPVFGCRLSHMTYLTAGKPLPSFRCCGNLRALRTIPNIPPIIQGKIRRMFEPPGLACFYLL